MPESLYRPAKYTVGIAAEPEPCGKYYEEREAIEKASQMHAVYGFTTAVAVWDERNNPVWLFMLGEQFQKV